MHNATSRFNSITFFWGIVMAIFCGINFFHGYLTFTPQKANIQFKIDNIPSFNKLPQWQQASIKYSLTADLSQLYTWNLKQLYVYIQCEWKNQQTGLVSRSILNDWILESTQDRSLIAGNWIISAQNKRIEYNLRDLHNGLKNNLVKVYINVQYMPVVGPFFKAKLYETEFLMPSEYGTSLPIGQANITAQ